MSGIHGHDLTLGTGSYDGIFGGRTSLRYKDFFFQGDLQFTLRGDGLHQYHFANDLSWGGGPYEKNCTELSALPNAMR